MNERFLVESTVQRSVCHSQRLPTPRFSSSPRPHSEYPRLQCLSLRCIVICVILYIATQIIPKGSWNWLRNELPIPAPPAFWSYWNYIPTSRIARRSDALTYWQRTRDASEATNYALISSGAHIVRDLTSQTYDPRRGYFRRRFFAPIHFLRDKWLGFELSQIHLSLPRDAIDDANDRCWQLGGRHGQIAIALPVPISITHVSIGRARQMPASPEQPNYVRVWGLMDVSLALSFPDSPSHRMFSPANSIPQGIFVKLADIQSGLNGHLHPVTSLVAGHGIEFLVFEVLSNQGGDFTCLYGLGVYGSRLDHS
ncbi:hypothetical protein EYR40_009196 [Pleurotus pulmonarius]|nr:hypothetical protein EYR36_005437 [Pleurotus pulmonarius]KAF4590601.1 hypothetical protein EYR40_009196 [Pleurotus pulmonarius]